MGTYLKETPFMWLVYSLLGAKIHPSASLNAFIREFDLVKIGRYVTIDYQIRCRKFGPWEENTEGPTLRFRNISIEDQCVIKGHVSPGVKMGEGSHLEKISSLLSPVVGNECSIYSPQNKSNSVINDKQIGPRKFLTRCRYCLKRYQVRS